jgi:hypothetical protein
LDGTCGREVETDAEISGGEVGTDAEISGGEVGIDAEISGGEVGPQNRYRIDAGHTEEIVDTACAAERRILVSLL